jgi:rare lipoprotein A
MKYSISLLLVAASFVLYSSFANAIAISTNESPQVLRDTVKKPATLVDTIQPGSVTLYKSNAHASYYADKFTGRRTASGKRFDNTKYTCAHKKLPFGTLLKVTNERNGKSVIVTVTDRGPFTKGREIDLTKKAFMEIASNKGGGSLLVTIEIIK